LGWNNSLRREPWWNAVRRARSKRARAASQDAAVLPCVCRRSASPFYLREEKSKWRVVDREERFSQFATGPTRNSDADRVARAGSLAPSAPAIAGEGDHWSSRSERTVVEGAHDSTLRCRCRTVPQTSLDILRSEMIWLGVSSACGRHYRNDVAARAPSAALRAVPSPAIAGADGVARYRGAG
jgi:hypothetical protein